MHVKFFHDLVLELAGGKGGALNSGSRRRCFRLETAERRHGIVGGVGEGVGSSGQLWVERRQEEGRMAVAGDRAGVRYITPFSQTGPSIAKWRKEAIA